MFIDGKYIEYNRNCIIDVDIDIANTLVRSGIATYIKSSISALECLEKNVHIKKIIQSLELCNKCHSIVYSTLSDKIMNRYSFFISKIEYSSIKVVVYLSSISYIFKYENHKIIDAINKHTEFDKVSKINISYKTRKTCCFSNSK